MPVDFGYIEDYKDRASGGKTGFGFVSRTIWSSGPKTSKVFFHIKQIKRKYPDLAQKLDDGLYFRVGFWYKTDFSEKGEQVSEIWLQGSEIPQILSKDLTIHIEDLWKNIQISSPGWLDKVTVELGGQAYRDQLSREREELIQKRREKEARNRLELERKIREYEAEQRRVAEEAYLRAEAERKARIRVEEEAERQEEQERQLKVAERLAKIRAQQESKQQQLDNEVKVRTDQIRRFCQNRGITTLIHFTHIQNLHRILVEGLLCRESLERVPSDQQSIFNDNIRIDNCPEAISLSISFPNYQMFYSFNRLNQAEWVVLLLDPAILWEFNCAFCGENAASNNVRFIPLEERRRFCVLEEMFADEYLLPRQQLQIPDSYPTHPQAEVLVFDPIPPHFVREVHFRDVLAVSRWRGKNPGAYEQQLNARQEYFRPRLDWRSWKQPMEYKTNSIKQ